MSAIVNKNVRLDADLDAWLKAVAAERQVSVNLLITVAIRRYLQDLIPLADLLHAPPRTEEVTP